MPQKTYRLKKIIDLDTIFIKDDILSYSGYDIERSFDQTKTQSLVTINKDGKRILYIVNDNPRIINSEGFHGWRESVNIGLLDLINKDTKNLIIEQTTGGSCCVKYKIYELSANIRPIFDDEEYNTIGDVAGIGLSVKIPMVFDFYGKGRYELVRIVRSFNYAYGLCHACSPNLFAIFSYREKVGKYVLSNKEFSDFLLGDIKQYIDKFEDIDTKTSIDDYIKRKPLTDDNYNNWLSKILNISLSYIYAGKEKEGWYFFNSRYKLPNKEEIRSDIIKRLNNDPVYKAIYGR